MPTLSIYVPDQEPFAVDLAGIEKLSVGRGPENDVVLDHISLSGSHAVIQNNEGVYQVTDLGSTNGTFANGEQVTDITLSEGLQIAFGSVQAVFSEGAEAASEALDADAGVPAEAGGGESSAHGHPLAVADVSSVPVGFKNLSPIEKVEKKDTLGQIAVIVGVVAILAAVTLVALSAIMKAA